MGTALALSTASRLVRAAHRAQIHSLSARHFHQPGAMREHPLARYGKSFKNKVLAKLLPPNTSALEDISQVVVSVDTFERWRSESLAMPARERSWSAAARLNAVITTAAMDEASRSAWRRENGVYPQGLEAWRQSATEALAEPEEQRATPKQTAADRRRIKDLERELRRKDKALAETAALLVLSKRLDAIFPKGEHE